MDAYSAARAALLNSARVYHAALVDMFLEAGGSRANALSPAPPLALPTFCHRLAIKLYTRKHRDGALPWRTTQYASHGGSIRAAAELAIAYSAIVVWRVVHGRDAGVPVHHDASSIFGSVAIDIGGQASSSSNLRGATRPFSTARS